MSNLIKPHVADNQEIESTTIDNYNSLIKNVVRFDRNIAKNGIQFTRFEEDADLMFDLVVYFANSYQDNFFGFGKLDVDDFCAKMNYKKSNLFKSHHAPAQFKDLGIKKAFEKITKKLSAENIANGKNSINKDDFFYTVLDNALYRLSTDSIPFKFKVKSNDVNNNLTTAIKIIKTLNKQYKDSTKAKSELKKIVYYYTLDDDFINNLTRWFLNINLYSVAKLRKSNSVYLYSFLKNLQLDLIALNKTSTDTIDFDLLLELAQIFIMNNPRRSKQQLIIKIENIFNVTDLKGKIDFIKRTNAGKEVGYAYQPVITFFSPVSKLNSKEYYQDILNAVTTRFLHASRQKYSELQIYKTLKLSFSDWFLSSINSPIGDESYTIVRTIGKQAYEFIIKETMSIGDTRVTNLLKNSVKVILEMKDKSQLSK